MIFLLQFLRGRTPSLTFSGQSTKIQSIPVIKGFQTLLSPLQLFYPAEGRSDHGFSSFLHKKNRHTQNGHRPPPKSSVSGPLSAALGHQH